MPYLLIKKLKLLSLLLFFFCLKTAAQSFYVSAYKIVGSGTDVYKVTILPGGGVKSELMNSCPLGYYFSIAMSGNDFYWLDGVYMFKSTIDGLSMSDCKPLISVPGSPNNLTVGPDGNVYYISGQIHTIDPVTLQTNNYGSVNYYSLGDVTFYESNLYMAAAQGIVKIDTKNAANSILYMPLSSTLNIYGMVCVATSLHKNTVYALSVTGASTNILELDLDNKVIKGVVGTLPYSVLDAASPVENGSINGIVINSINNRQDCDAPTKGIVEVVTTPSLNPLTYKLSNAGTTLTNTTGVFTAVPAGSYQVTVTSSIDQQTAPVVVPTYTLTKPQYSYTIKNQVCDQMGEITFKTTDANSTYLVRLGSDVFPINHTFTGLVSGAPYHFDILNEFGCKVDGVDINVPKDKCTIKFNKVDVEQQCDVIHKGTLQVVTNAHYDQYTYTLNGVSNTTGAFSNLVAGSYTIKITSPEDAISVTAIVPDYKLTQPAIGYLATDPACAAKGSIKFSIPGSSTGYTIKYGAGSYPFDHVFEGLSPGIYNFIVADPKGCLIDQYNVELKYQPCPIVINAINFTAECYAFGKAVVQVVTPPIPETYSYTLNGVTNNTGVFNLVNPGSYNLLVTASGGGIPQNRTVIVPDFKLDRPITVIKTVRPVCELLGQISLAVGTDAKLYDVSYNNSVYPSDHVFRDLAAGTYEFNILKKDGCIADIIDVDLVLEVCSPVSFPSAFTPNNDGINDVFEADPKSKATNFKFQIYNRWGQMVFTSTDLHAGWDGRYNGGACAVGTYYWIATFTNQENKPAMQKGYVTLIR